MQRENLYATESEKSNKQFVDDLAAVAAKYGFIIPNKDFMDMAKTFSAHGAEVKEGFDLHMIQLCKPVKAAMSLQGNPERAILMPKFIMVFTADNKTQIRFLSYTAEDISSAVDDEVFPGSLAETYAVMKKMIDEAK